MTDDDLLYLYFCLDADTREVVAAFGEFSKSPGDQRYVMRVSYQGDGPEEIEWILVEGAPVEMTSHDFDVYSQSVTETNASHEFGFVKALELLSAGELDEEFLIEGSTFIPHR
jgi:hypothetical protein